MKIQAILFDLDDTLWPVAPVIQGAEQALQAWIAQHYPVIAEQYDVAAWRQRRQEISVLDPRYAYDLWALRLDLLRQVFAEFGVTADAASEAMQVFAHARNQVDLYADVRPALQVLQQRFRLGSISNGFADLQQIGLAQHFEVMLAAHQEACAKPDPRLFNKACEVLGLSAPEILFVGDDPEFDVAGAKAVGMQAAWLKREDLPHTKPARVDADILVQDLQQLLVYLL